MKRAIAEKTMPAISSTYVWRVVLCYEATDKFTELLVLCDDPLPGEKFQKAVENTFYVYKTLGKIPEGHPTELKDYVNKMTTNIGFAAGTVNDFEPKGVAIGEFKNGMPILLDAERAQQLAGLSSCPEPQKVQKADVAETERQTKLKKLAKQKDADASIKELLLDTAMDMAKNGDLGSADETMIQQAVAAVQVTNPFVFNPAPPKTQEQQNVLEKLFLLKIKTKGKVNASEFTEAELIVLKESGLVPDPNTNVFFP